MSQKANYLIIGAFMIGAITLLAAAVIVLGAGALFRTTIAMETYINESVQGLEVGSPVKYRGVLIGNVDMIDFVRNVCSLPSGAPIEDDRRRYVYVRARIEPKKLGPRIARTQAEVNALAARGLRVRLASQGITGVAYLELDYVDPARNPPLDIEWEPSNLYLPSAPSTFMRFTDAVDTILRQVQSLDVETLSRRAGDLLTAAKETLDSADVKGVSQEVRRLEGSLARLLDERIGPLVDHADQLVAKLDRTTDDANVKALSGEAMAIASELRGTNRTAQELLRGMSQTVANVDGTTGQLATQAGHVMKRLDRLLVTREQDLAAVLDNVRLITEHLKGLSGDAQRYPSQVLFGEPPTRTEPKKP